MWFRKLRKKTKRYKVGDKYIRITPYYMPCSCVEKCEYCDTPLEHKVYREVRYRKVPDGAKDLKILEHHIYKYKISCPRCGLTLDTPPMRASGGTIG